jgi:predicted amidohydrolase
MTELPASSRSSVVFGAVQMSSQDRIDENLAHAAALVAEARRRCAEVVLLPENFALMGTEEQKLGAVEPLVVGEIDDAAGPIHRMLRDTARREGLFLVAGGMPGKSADPRRPFNASVVVSPTGAVEAVYRKVHLFDVDVGDGATYRESASTSGGDTAVVHTLRDLGVGLSVCYDLRFPELYRAEVDRGAEVLTVPAAFTLATGKDHWTVLLRARAIESQCYVVAAAQWGAHPGGRRTYGKSCIVDPWGDVVAQASEGEGVVVAEIDPARIARVRASLPSLRHRRL